MNTTSQTHLSDACDASDGRIIQLRTRALLNLLCLIVLAVGFTGCSFLKPAKSTARHYVLTPIAGRQAGSGSLTVGLGQVKLPAYLFDTSLAVRKSNNEIEYLNSALWAERLDAGLQRVLAANLGTLLPTDQIRLSAWQTGDVSVEVYVVIERFDVDARGQGVLAGWWRVLSPGGEKTLKAGKSRLTRQGPAPGTDPSGAVATLSELAADLSRQVAQAVKETTAASGSGSVKKLPLNTIPAQ
jgi:uncharacterized lipoprotein YmbA